MPRQRPPPGIRSLSDWQQICPEPSILDLFSRFVSVMDAVERHRLVEIEPLPEWLEELGVAMKR